MGPGLIWGLDFSAEGAITLERCDGPPVGGFRWLHLNLAEHGTRAWIADNEMLPAGVRELLLSPDTHQRALVDGETVGCVLHDFERDFDRTDTDRVGALRIALMPTLMLTLRQHPLRSADIVRSRLSRGALVREPGQALDLLVGAITDNVAEIGRSMSVAVQKAEDGFLDGRDPPSARDLIRMRRRLTQLHRLLAGTRNVFQRLEHDDETPEALLPAIEKLVQRLQSLDADVVGIQAQWRQLREEVDIQAAQRTNQNLYILSIITALMLPATLVTGIFGMNTGGMPFQLGAHGTLYATGLAALAAGATYLALRWMGFMRS